MHLNTEQLEFLKNLSEVDNIERCDIDDSQISMILYLKKQGLISIDRDFSGAHILNHNQKIEDVGEITSVWISEQGKAYLAEVLREDEFSKSIEKIAKSAEIQSDIALKTSKKADIKGWIAVIISAITLFIEFMAYHKEIFLFIGKLFN